MTESKQTTNQTYKVHYKIDHGVSHGFGVVYDEQSEEVKEFSAPSPLEACIQADNYAEEIADNWICNTQGKVRVYVIHFYDAHGRTINILDELKTAVSASEQFEQFKKDRFPDGSTLTTERTWIDHILKKELEKNKK